MRFVMLGAGAIGGVVGGQLAKAGFDVVFVDTPRRARGGDQSGRPPPRGVHGHHVLRVPAVSDVGALCPPRGRGRGPRRLLVKSYHTDAAMAALRRATPLELPVFCAQNGVRNEEVAPRHVRAVHGVMVMIGAKRLVAGEVVHTSKGPLGVGTWPSGLSDARGGRPRRRQDRSALYTTGEITVHKWNKLVVNLNNATIGLIGLSGDEAQRRP